MSAPQKAFTEAGISTPKGSQHLARRALSRRGFFDPGGVAAGVHHNRYLGSNSTPASFKNSTYSSLKVFFP